MIQKVFLNVSKYVATWLIISIWSSLSADVKGKVSISYSVAQSVCSSTVKFARSSQIEQPSKSPTLNESSACKTLIWGNNCGLSVTGTGTGTGSTACQKFEPKECPSKRSHHNRWGRKMSRIVNGADATPHEFPHIVRITFKGRHHCDGTILNENYIVTAAHCFYFDFVQFHATAADYQVIAGDHNTAVDEGVEQVRKVKNVAWHDGFEIEGDDIAVVLLEQPLEFTENVFPPKMPEPNYDGTGQVVTVIGWGVVYEGGPLAHILQKVDLKMLSPKVCDAAFASVLPEPAPVGTFCAAGEGGVKTSCAGDSGGPATIRVEDGCDLFVGIVSFGVNCIDPYPSVYTQVSKYIDWISTHTA